MRNHNTRLQQLHKRCEAIVDNGMFQKFIFATIVVAGILVGLQTYGESVAQYETLFERADTVILAIFTLEVVLKMVGKGPRYLSYFRDSWNVFDFLIVAVALVSLFLPTLNAGFVAVLRLVRILRVFKLVTAIPKLQLLVNALLKSIPSMGYIGMLLGLLFYIYSAMAVFLFGENDPVHFTNLQTAMLSLFRVVTLEDWTDIMYINMHGCDNELSGYSATEGCTSPQGYGVFAALFFVSFVLIGTMIVLNLFIGVIMNSMDDARAEAEALDDERQVAKAAAELDAGAGSDLETVLPVLAMAGAADGANPSLVAGGNAAGTSPNHTPNPSLLAELDQLSANIDRIRAELTAPVA
jgi:voltage-gated sodium channel